MILRLIQVKTRKPVATITGGGTYDFTAGDKTIEALPVTGAVRFNFDCDGLKHSEGKAPFHALGDDVPWNPAPGKRTVKVDAISSTGAVVDTVTVTITAAGAAPPPAGDVVHISSGTTDNINLKPGNRIVIASGASITNARGLNPPADCVIGTAKPDDVRAKVKVPSPPGRNIDFLASGAAGIIVQGLEVETIATGIEAAVRLSGDNQRVINVAQVGTGFALRWTGADMAFCDLIYANTGSCLQYCAGSFDGTDDTPDSDSLWCDDCQIIRFDWLQTHKNWHCGRFSHTRRCVWGSLDEKIRLPEIADNPGLPVIADWPAFKGGLGFAARSRTSGGALTSLAVNHGEDAKFYRLLLDTLGVGPIHIWAGTHPDWRMKRPKFFGCDLGRLAVNLGTEAFEVDSCLIRGLDLNANRNNKPGAPNFPPCTGVIKNSLLLCEPVNAAGVSYVNCRKGSKDDGSDAKPF